MNAPHPIVSIQNLNLSYEADETVLTKFSLEIFQGEKVALTGESGSGKTSLLNLLAGFVQANSGKINLFNLDLNIQNIKEIRRRLAWLPQNTAVDSTNVETLLMAPFQFAANKIRKPESQEIQTILDAFMLSKSLLKKSTSEISGGQKQRILLASCLLQKKELLLLDEPTSALDEAGRKQITDFVLSIPHTSIIASTHDSYWIKKSGKIIEF